jgi:hypothetical protein
VVVLVTPSQSRQVAVGEDCESDWGRIRWHSVIGGRPRIGCVDTVLIVNENVVG